MLRVENAVQLTRGDLENKVSISYFERLQPNAKKIKRGDLFLAFETDDIKLAIENGAHGILTDSDIESFGEDIAWIRVRDAKKASLNLLKYELLNLKCDYIVCEPIIFFTAKELIDDATILFLDPDNAKYPFEHILNHTIRAIVSYDESLLQYLSSDEQKLFHTPRSHGFVVRKSSALFSEILWGDIWQVPYPEVLLRYLKGALDLAKEFGILVNPKPIPPSPCYEPAFVAKGIYECDFGKSSQVIIFSRLASNAILRDIADFIATKASWGDRLYIFPMTRTECKPSHAIIMHYGSTDELVNLLEDGIFCYALVADIEKENLIKQRKLNQLSLFD
ncbi:MAG: hypothetical protein RL154_1133 [Pseudomonadota bacterium]|jgi:ferrochelatase